VFLSSFIAGALLNQIQQFIQKYAPQMRLAMQRLCYPNVWGCCSWLLVDTCCCWHDVNL
jgi:hypothetical protein